MDFWAVLPGCIWSFVLGISLGNYICSYAFRLPRGIKLFEKHPFCSNCGTPLKTADLFPVVSWLMRRGKASCCGLNIPSQYLWIELALGFCFVTAYLHYGFSEVMLLVLAVCSLLILWVGGESEDKKFFTHLPTLGALLAFSALLRMKLDSSIYPFLGWGFAMLFISAAIYKWQGRWEDGRPPLSIWPWALLGVLIADGAMLMLASLTVLFFSWGCVRNFVPERSFGFAAVMLLVILLSPI